MARAEALRRFRPSSPRNGCFSADVEFVVDTAGLPEIATARVARATDPQFGEAVLAVVPRWKYEPARVQGRPVRQLVVEHQAVSAITRVDVLVPKGGGPPSSLPPERVPSC